MSPPSLEGAGPLRYAAYYFILVILIGGIAYTPWVLASYDLVPSAAGTVSALAGGISPFAATVIVMHLQFGRRGPAHLINQFSLKKAAPRWLLVSILVPIAIALSSVLLLRASGAAYSPDTAGFVMFLPLLPLMFIQNVWEEIGWRGYALPALQGRYCALVSSLIVGIFWALWHWPHFAVKDSVMASNYNNFLWFAVATLLISFTYTWLYNSSGGSLLVTSLFHASTNSVNYAIFTVGGIASSVVPFYLLTVGAVSLALLLLFKPCTLSASKKVTFKVAGDRAETIPDSASDGAGSLGGAE